MSSQSAIAVTEVGKPVTRITLPKPEESELAEHELLLKVSVAGLAPLDAKMRDRNPFSLPLPIVLTGDIVGKVIQTGTDVQFPISNHVFVQQVMQRPNRGGLQEHTIVDGRYAALVPEGIPDAEAALYPINAVTSAKSLFTPEGFDFPFPGTAEAAGFDFAAQHVVVLGGGTNCGKLAVQFARLAGVGRVVAVASAAGGPLLRSLGATLVVDRRSAGVKEQVYAAVEGEVLNVYDTYGSLDLGVSLLSEKRKGTLVHTTHGKVSEEVISQKKAKFDQKFVKGFSDSIPLFGQRFWKQFPVWLKTGDIKPLDYIVIEGMDVDKINEVLDLYRDGKGGDRYHVRLSSLHGM
ncbi:NAD(P)-binding protein [Lophium mytilinum]|uniref:NAD(P)-binding protein n=1 Tax=Lophium mytilinum TaxID=390894 RepID=A0A6A6QBW3_9PEZI|nr:NAD(P)-binding protein [Lophium mytilinum]